MKKNELYNMAINLVIIIALVIINMLTSLSSKAEDIISVLIYLGMGVLFIQVAKSIYGRIEKDKNSPAILKKLTIAYIVVSIIYVLSNQFVENTLVVFITLCTVLAVLFAFAADYSAEMLKRINKKDRIGLIKVSIILLTLLILCLLTSLISKTVELNSMFSLAVYLTMLTSVILLSILAIIFVFKKLVFVK